MVDINNNINIFALYSEIVPGSRWVRTVSSDYHINHYIKVLEPALKESFISLLVCRRIYSYICIDIVYVQTVGTCIKCLTSLAFTMKDITNISKFYSIQHNITYLSCVWKCSCSSFCRLAEVSISSVDGFSNGSSPFVRTLLGEVRLLTSLFIWTTM